MIWTLAAHAIIGGSEVEGTNPEVVATYRTDAMCTGTVVHPRWVLTAAHCWDTVDLSTMERPLQIQLLRPVPGLRPTLRSG